MEKKTIKNKKEDYTARALFHLAREYCEKYSEYAKELIEHLSKDKTKKEIDEIEGYVWEAIINEEKYETFLRQ